jgi:hypothetical protein
VPPRLQLTGQRFGRLLVMGFVYTKGGKSYSWCRCDCGNGVAILGTSLGRNTNSCGCLHSEAAAENGRSESRIRKITKHGKTGTPEHRAWKNMIQRCTNPNHPRYADWGGRGITVCDRWQGEHGFENFLADMGEKPEPKSEYSIDRRENNEGYSPSNCIWETRIEQMRNQRPKRPRLMRTQEATETAVTA